MFVRQTYKKPHKEEDKQNGNPLQVMLFIITNICVTNAFPLRFITSSSVMPVTAGMAVIPSAVCGGYDRGGAGGSPLEASQIDKKK